MAGAEIVRVVAAFGSSGGGSVVFPSCWGCGRKLQPLPSQQALSRQGTAPLLSSSTAAVADAAWRTGDTDAIGQTVEDKSAAAAIEALTFKLGETSMHDNGHLQNEKPLISAGVDAHALAERERCLLAGEPKPLNDVVTDLTDNHQRVIEHRISDSVREGSEKYIIRRPQDLRQMPSPRNATRTADFSLSSGPAQARSPGRTPLGDVSNLVSLHSRSETPGAPPNPGDGISRQRPQWECSACCIIADDGLVHFRYSVSFIVSRQRSTERITVFGDVLNPIFGLSATQLHRRLERKFPTAPVTFRNRQLVQALSQVAVGLTLVASGLPKEIVGAHHPNNDITSRQSHGQLVETEQLKYKTAKTIRQRHSIIIPSPPSVSVAELLDLSDDSASNFRQVNLSLPGVARNHTSGHQSMETLVVPNTSNKMTFIAAGESPYTPERSVLGATCWGNLSSPPPTPFRHDQSRPVVEFRDISVTKFFGLPSPPRSDESRRFSKSLDSDFTIAKSSLLLAPESPIGANGPQRKGRASELSTPHTKPFQSSPTLVIPDTDDRGAQATRDSFGAPESNCRNLFSLEFQDPPASPSDRCVQRFQERAYRPRNTERDVDPQDPSASLSSLVPAFERLGLFTPTDHITPHCSSSSTSPPHVLLVPETPPGQMQSLKGTSRRFAFPKESPSKSMSDYHCGSSAGTAQKREHQASQPVNWCIRSDDEPNSVGSTSCGDDEGLETEDENDRLTKRTRHTTVVSNAFIPENSPSSRGQAAAQRRKRSAFGATLGLARSTRPSSPHVKADFGRRNFDDSMGDEQFILSQEALAELSQRLERRSGAESSVFQGIGALMRHLTLS
ncbi:hypothetical protein DFJ73DRAFT_958011 [Zopfochytrium polystomum]|nr:hypothetical protein DFJ73DRAFT_958011 [Zopfochytrium polystomum]